MDRGEWFTDEDLELEALHWSFLLREKELLVGLVHLRSEAAVLILHAEVTLDEVKRLLVDLLVVVALEELNLVQSCKKTNQNMNTGRSLKPFP